MKKALFVAALMLAISAASVMADNGSADLTTGTASNAGATVFGGSTSTIAKNQTNPLVKFSTGVKGLANYNTGGYSVFTKHGNGSKVFGTANDSTSIYWLASTADLSSTVTGSTVGNGNFSGGSITWTTY